MSEAGLATPAELAAPVAALPPEPGAFRAFWRRFCRRRGALAGLVVVVLLAVLALARNLFRNTVMKGT